MTSTSISKVSSWSSFGHDEDANGCVGSDDESGYISDRNFVAEEDVPLKTARTEREPQSDTRGAQTKHRYTGNLEYTAACNRLGILPASRILSRLRSDRLSLRHALLDPTSATALSVGLAANRCIKVLNLGSNLLGDESARLILEAISDTPSMTKLDLSRNLLSDRFGHLLAKSLSSPLCALRDLVLAENFLTDSFTEAVSKGTGHLAMLYSSPVQSLDLSSNKICDRNNALSGILRNCSRLASLNLSWNDLRTVENINHTNEMNEMRCAQSRKLKNENAGPCVTLISAALVDPGRLISLELSFNGLTDVFGVAIGSMLKDSTALSVLDLSRNHLGTLSALSISDGLKTNRSLGTLKLGWNPLGREGTLGIIQAIGENHGPLQVVRLENTSDAGTEFEAAREADSVIATKSQWVEVVCEYPDRERVKGNSGKGPVSWMTEYSPDKTTNTTYRTQAEVERDELLLSPKAHSTPSSANANGRGASSTSHSKSRMRAPPPTNSKPSSLSPRTARSEDIIGKGTLHTSSDGGQRSPVLVGPKKEVLAVPVLSVRMKLRAQEEARLDSQRITVAVEEEGSKKQQGAPSYLKPLNKRVKDKTLAAPPSRLLLLENLKTDSSHLVGHADRKSEGVASRRGHSAHAVPGYMRSTSGSKVRNFQRSFRVAARSVQSANRIARGRAIKGKAACEPAKTACQSTRVRSGSQRRAARGRSLTTGRRMDESRKASRKGRFIQRKRRDMDHRTSNSDGRSRDAVSPREPSWITMSTLAHVSHPTRLKCAGQKEQQKQLNQ